MKECQDCGQPLDPVLDADGCRNCQGNPPFDFQETDEGLPTAEDVKGILREDWKPRIFKALHDPARPLRHIADAYAREG